MLLILLVVVADTFVEYVLRQTVDVHWVHRIDHGRRLAMS